MSFNDSGRLPNRPLAFTAGTWLRAVVFVLLLCAVRNAQAENTSRLASPDKRIQLTIEMPAANSPERPRWSATFRGKTLLSDCRLELQTAEAGDLMAGVRVVRSRERSLNRRVRVLFGKSDHADDRFREIRLTRETREARRADAVFRCYDDAIALRYEMSAKGPRQLNLPLSSLGARQYTAKIWKDATDSGTNPNQLATETLRVSSGDRLKVTVALDGGFVAQLTTR